MPNGHKGGPQDGGALPDKAGGLWEKFGLVQSAPMREEAARGKSKSGANLGQ